jgi:transcription factor SOX7/8/10/18 (SOX group E/F)
MLFRADFVRQKHVPGSIETNHGSLSKIIGNCWRALPLEEKRIWEIKAKHAKAEHKQMYPNYRFRPVHNKNKEKKPKTLIPAEDEKRCEDVAQLLLEGMKGEELAAAVERLDRMRSTTPINLPRRPSSVPLPNSFPIAIPALPFVEPSHPHSPQQMNPPRYTLPRRPSSAGPAFYRSWGEPFAIPREPSPMPEINASLFNGAYLDNAFPGTGSHSDASFDFGSMFGSLPGGSPQEMFISPLENVMTMDSQNAYASLVPANPYTHISSTNSPVPPSTYSGSPAPSDFSLSMHASHTQSQSQRVLEAMAPQVQAKSTTTNLDGDMAAYAQGLANFNIPLDMGLSYVVPEMPPLSFDISEQMFSNALQEHQQQQQAHVPIAAPVAVPVDAGFAFNDMINEF